MSETGTGSLHRGNAIGSLAFTCQFNDCENPCRCGRRSPCVRGGIQGDCKCYVARPRESEPRVPYLRCGSSAIMNLDNIAVRIGEAFQPAPIPRITRPLESASSEATCFARWIGSCSVTRHTPAPILICVVTIAAAIMAINKS
jgi:hypothetical protein